MKPGERLAEQLMIEANRRQKLGHVVSAHELRGLARTVSNAQFHLDHSKKIKKP